MFLHLVNIAYHTGGNWFPPLSETFTRHEREPLLAGALVSVPKILSPLPHSGPGGWVTCCYANPPETFEVEPRR